MLIFGGYKVVNGTMSLGELVCRLTPISGMVNAPMRNLGNLVNMLTNTSTSAEKLFYYWESGPSIKNCINPKYVSDIRGDVKFDHVTVTYGDERFCRCQL